jgi:hypothetical protein
METQARSVAKLVTGGYEPPTHSQRTRVSGAPDTATLQ